MNQRILELRTALGLTQAEFAERIGMASHTIYKWEHSRVEIKPSSLLLIELVFNVNPEWLHKGKGRMFKSILIPSAEKLMDWLKSLPEDDQTWAIKEIERHIPEFKKWRTE